MWMTQVYTNPFQLKNLFSSYTVKYCLLSIAASNTRDTV